MARFDLRQHNLPRDVTSFIGRESERVEVLRLLRSTQLLTLVGAGGVGKTRLAVQVGHAALADYPDGVWLIELGPLTDPDLVPQLVAQVLGVREQPDIPLVNTLYETLGRTRQLLVLDNCEHLIDAAARLADGLQRTCPHVSILATSREPLGVAGEILWRVPTLTLPRPEDEADDADAVRLFLERARASLPSFEITSSNRPSVIQICRQLDGLPLAIELAAARVRLLSTDELSNRLEDRFKLLTDGSRTAPGRQQTLEATVNWSYELLSAGERRLFEDMAVFVDGFTLGGLSAVTGESDTGVLSLLGRLVDRSLVVVEPPRTGEQTRYRLLETLRAFAWQRLVARGDADQRRQRLAEWLIEMAERANAGFHGPDQGHWLRWAEAERGTARAVLQWVVQRQDTEAALRLATSLWWSWIQRGRRRESLAAFEQCVGLPGASTHRRLWATLILAGGMFGIIDGTGDENVARARLQEALRIGLELDDPWIYLNARAGLTGIIDMRTQQDPDRVRASAEELLAEARRVGNTWAENRALVSIAMVALKQRDFDRALPALEEAADVARRAGDSWSLAMTLAPLGDLERSRGRHTRAGQLYRDCLAHFAEIGLAEHPLEHPYLLHNLGYVALAEGQPLEGGQRFREAIAGYRRLGDARGVAECLIGLGATAACAARPMMAIQLFAAGEAALVAAGRDLWHSNQADYRHWRGVAAAAVQPTEFEAAWAAGGGLSVDEALSLAAGQAAVGHRGAATDDRAGGAATVLTPREREVAQLVAAGLTNRQIGQTLVITEKTAANHVQRVLDKLAVHSRAQLAARSKAFGLDPSDSATG